MSQAERIPKAKKARIIAEKRVGLGTTKAIAKRHGVAAQTVRNLAYSPPAAVVPMVEKLTQRFNEEAIDLAGLVFKELKRRVKDKPKDESTKDLVAVGKMSYEVHRLETNQPTSINQSNQAPIDRALKYAEILIGKYKPEDARKIFRASKTARIGMGASEEEWIEAEVATFDK